MRLVQVWLSRILAAARRSDDRAVADELDAHLRAHIDDNLNAGMSAAEARRDAMRALGGVAQATESWRDQRHLPFVEKTMQDVRYALRMLAKTPGFSIVAIATLALGIGANTAIFSIINAVLLEPLPFKDPARVVVLWEENSRRPGRANVVGPANYLRWLERSTSFESMGAFTAVRGNLTGTGAPQELVVHVVTTGFFETLGVTPLIGRTFTPEEGAPPGSQAAVLSHALWSTRFGGDRSIVGRTIQVGGNTVRVIGVMPPGVRLALRNGNGTKPPDMWAPLALSAEMRQPRGRFMSVVARLKPGVSIEQARAEMATIASTLEMEFPQFDTGWTARVVPLRDELAGEVKPALMVLAGAVVFVLLIACVNVANLLLARGARRQHEIAVRSAIGAGRARVVRQLLTESLLLGTLGGLSGLLVAHWTLKALLMLSPVDVAGLDNVGLSYPVLAFTAAASLATAVLAGFAPAFESSRADFAALKNGVRHTGTDVRRRRLRHGLVVAELALAVVLLVGAGLMLRSFAFLQRIDTGFDGHNILTMRVTLPFPRYSPQTFPRVFEQIVDRVRTLPGVRAAGAVNFLPFNELGAATGFTIVGQPAPPAGQAHVTDVRVADLGYFEAMRIPLRRGRWFSARELHERSNVVIVNEALARRYFADRDPVGQQLSIAMNDQSAPSEVIGIVGDVRYADLTDAVRPMSYWPAVQLPYPAMTLTVRTESNPLGLVGAVQREIQSIDKDQPIADVRTMEQWMSRALSRERFSSTLLTAFAALALALAAIGIYGVMSYAVSQRQSEIGVRLALGAAPGAVQRMVMRSGLQLAATGAVAGLVAGLVLSRAMGSLLYRTSPSDPIALASSVGVLAAVAALAIYVPARRASRLNPLAALRAE